MNSKIKELLDSPIEANQLLGVTLAKSQKVTYWDIAKHVLESNRNNKWRTSREWASNVSEKTLGCLYCQKQFLGIEIAFRVELRRDYSVTFFVDDKYKSYIQNQNYFGSYIQIETFLHSFGRKIAKIYRGN